jgi:hypothetical protein
VRRDDGRQRRPIVVTPRNQTRRRPTLAQVDVVDRKLVLAVDE